MSNKADTIISVIYGIIIILPLFYFVFKIFSYLLNKNIKKRTFHVILSIVGIIVLILIIYFIASAFWFPKLFQLPRLLGLIIGILGMLYVAGGLGVLYGLGRTAGLAGKSPSNVIKDFIDNFSERDSKDKKEV